jgi:hypothetical protein
MSAAKFEMGNEGFALLTRVFMALKRAGRVVDMVWFQHNPEYARVVLGLIEETTDADGKEAGKRLRETLEASGFLPASRRVSAPKPAPEPESVPLLDEPVADTATDPDKPPAKRYTTTLR